ncbi:glucose-6-phosphate dehydrogenase [Lysobacter gummosus]|jgi:glucose-6-phosphate 1-dehydrogenase|uniref:Glucose-6-phosphate 1-dehydrogenase n=1 Tax=Lysobacter gummosus TaxID=262324 RepID=A0ABY3X499_9GAMM|nr:glucose-6-phosphate dehydrogenase [Lysobacter gummosus]ALN91735.1 glucose-6-phosphate dehydrogenase [Lysobacter gummosus]UNP27406.1 glucose-6-phosphate dehydrogenase [Lysobacter gummosus]
MHDTLLLFGATGDLSQRYLFPSLVHLWRDRLLPPAFRIVAVGRQELSDDDFRAWLRERMAGEVADDQTVVEELLGKITYVSVDLRDETAISTALASYADRPSVSYLATPPDLFVPCAKGLKAAGLLEGESRLVLEKPIGRDLASAREINAALKACLDESRIFRIDHYLGKAAVQNLLALRLGNTLLEAVWEHRWIESVDIFVGETAGVDGREGYYANYGALRDMVQNHMLQLLALIAMEPPSVLDADSIRDEKRKVLRALRPMSNDDVASRTVRGRYAAGVVEGRAVKGFVHESTVETFVAVETYIDNWRWAGVPFRLVTGKRLAERATEVVVSFRPTSHWLFERPRRGRERPNRLRMRLQPDETIELGLMGSLAAPEWGAMELKPMSLDLSMSGSPQRRIAYERLIVDVLRGNQTLFVRDDEVEAAWHWIDSIETAWTQTGQPALEYPAGSWGPSEAERYLPPTNGYRPGNSNGGGHA